MPLLAKRLQKHHRLVDKIEDLAIYLNIRLLSKIAYFSDEMKF